MWPLTSLVRPPGATLFFSFIIPTSNEERWIAHCLRSVQACLASSPWSGETIVCDAESPDETAARARHAGATRVIITPGPRAHQFEVARLQARGDVLVFLHADTCLRPGALGAIFEAHRRGDIGGWFQLDVRAEIDARHDPGLALVAMGINARTRHLHTATGDQAIWATRQALEAIGGVPQQPLLEGWELVKRLRAWGPTSTLGRHLWISGRRWEHTGIVRTQCLMWALRLAYMAGAPPDSILKVWHDYTRSS